MSSELRVTQKTGGDYQQKVGFHQNWRRTLLTGIYRVCSILKNKGFSEVEKATIFKELSIQTDNKNVKTFIENILGYLENLIQKSIDLGEKSILCSSDIIESFFGKFKQKINPNCPHKLTEFMFTIANFSDNFNEDELQKALESVKIKNLKKYKMT